MLITFFSYLNFADWNKICPLKIAEVNVAIILFPKNNSDRRSVKIVRQRK